MTVASADLHFPEDEPTGPVPIRFWWLKRLTVGLALLPVAVATLRLAWGWEAERRIAAADGQWAARVRAAGVSQPEFRPAAGADNGVDAIMDAAAALDRKAWSPSNGSADFPAAYTPYSPGWHEMARASVAANGKALTLARRARQYRRFDWGTGLVLNGPDDLYHRLNEVRALTNTLGDAAEYAHEAGDDVAALETVRDARHISTGLREKPMIVSDLVGIAVEAVALARLNEIAPGLRIAPENDRDALAANTDAARAAALSLPGKVKPRRRVTPANVRALIDELLDDGPRNRRSARAVAGERATLQEMAADPHNTRWLVRPMWRLDALRVDDVLGANVESAAQPSWPTGLDTLRAARSRLPVVPAPAMSLFRPATPTTRGARRPPIDFPRLLSQDFSGGLASGRAVEQNWRVAMERRLAAVGLAVQLYRAEHWRWPGSMGELVPKYLPRVPQDPMAIDGSGVRYMLVRGGLPGGGDRPIAYSAGADGAFDTLKGPRVPKLPMYSWTSGAGDQWRDLARWQSPAPATAPSTQAANH
jgi:hypothetical protein